MVENIEVIPKGSLREGLETVVQIPSGEEGIIHIAYKSRGLDSWKYSFADRLSLGEKFYHDENDLTLKEVINRYLREITPNKRGSDSEKRRLRRLLKESICLQIIKLLKTRDYIKFKNNRIKDGNKTCHYDLVLLRHIYNVAINQWNLFNGANPLINVPKPKLNLPRTRRLTEDEYNFLVKGNYSHEYLRPIIELALETGMRRGEILRIHYNDIGSQILTINQTKNGHPRTIPLTKRALCILKNAQLPFPMSANAVRLAWDRLKKKGNIKDLHFHDLRHEAISRFFEKGLSIPEVALISGHKDVRMLFRYTHLRAEDIVKKL